MDYHAIFFLGLPGAGKGTQAKRIAEKLGFFYWEMGAILREFMQGDSPFQNEIKELVNQGVLLTDDKILEVLHQRLHLIPEGQGIVFDGVPRRKSQAEFLIGHLRSFGQTHLATVHLVLSEEECVKRLLERAKTEGHLRSDDNPTAIEKRIHAQKEAQTELIGYLSSQTHYFEIDGAPPISEVAAKVDQLFDI